MRYVQQCLDITMMILESAGAPRSKDLAMSKPSDREISAEMTVHALQKGEVNIRLVMATLVVTVTLAAGLSIPGGYVDSSGADPGMATMLNRRMFHAFVICDTICDVHCHRHSSPLALDRS